MNELDQIWAQMLDEAMSKARASGRGNVVEYLQLKATNDVIRAASVKWLFDSMLEIAAEANRKNAAVTIENENPHRFPLGNAQLVGSLLSFRQGVRCLTLEAGWTRTPADGFMRGGALACARITHFGVSKANDELALIRENDLPNWFSVKKGGKRNLFDSNNLQNHFRVFLGVI
ncbi:MAG: hypothetical protein LC768_04330 [Acidobacteria bacterium]|nr:hypothetical protein [Acidobacteriota bacterium]MCA1637553.1 hypothetical protein [Acidobacteriota bacterium]